MIERGTMKPIYGVRVTEQQDATIKLLADREMRPPTQMVRVLIIEALAARAVRQEQRQPA